MLIKVELKFNFTFIHELEIAVKKWIYIFISLYEIWMSQIKISQKFGSNLWLTSRF